MPHRRGEDGVIARFTTEFAAAPAHRDGDDAGRVPRVVDRRHEVGHRIALRLDQQDIGRRRDRVGPFHVEGDLARPAGVGCRQTRRSRLTHLCERGVRQPERDVELFEVIGNIWVVVGIDDRDRRSRAVARDAAERDGVEAIRMPHGRRRQPRWAGGGRRDD